MPRYFSTYIQIISVRLNGHNIAVQISYDNISYPLYVSYWIEVNYGFID